VDRGQIDRWEGTRKLQLTEEQAAERLASLRPDRPRTRSLDRVPPWRAVTPTCSVGRCRPTPICPWTM